MTLRPIIWTKHTQQDVDALPYELRHEARVMLFDFARGRCPLGVTPLDDPDVPDVIHVTERGIYLCLGLYDDEVRVLLVRPARRTDDPR